jgi:hypothetical protein
VSPAVVLDHREPLLELRARILNRDHAGARRAVELEQCLRRSHHRRVIAAVQRPA